jgi:hypothetical protein
VGCPVPSGRCKIGRRRKTVLRCDAMASKKSRMGDFGGSADTGYRRWNPFEPIIQRDVRHRYDEVAKGFTTVVDAFER